MSYFLLPDGQREDIFGKDGAKNLAENININFLGSIPLDKEIRINSDQGDPTNLKKDYFDKIASKLIGLAEFL
jgi:ATP-binding protein involved in chromosome partitioning